MVTENRYNPISKKALLAGHFAGLLIGVGIVIGEFPLWIIGIATLVLGEIVFWRDKKAYDPYENRMYFTFKRKLTALAKVFAVFQVVNGLSSVITRLWTFIQLHYTAIINALTFLVIAIVILGIALLFLWLNSLKYRKNGKDTKKNGAKQK